jgi:hypothetical protein
MRKNSTTGKIVDVPAPAVTTPSKLTKGLSLAISETLWRDDDAQIVTRGKKDKQEALIIVDSDEDDATSFLKSNRRKSRPVILADSDEDM